MRLFSISSKATVTPTLLNESAISSLDNSRHDVRTHSTIKRLLGVLKIPLVVYSLFSTRATQLSLSYITRILSSKFFTTTCYFYPHFYTYLSNNDAAIT